MTEDDDSTFADRAVLGKVLEEHRPRLMEMLERRIDPRLAVRVSAEDVFHDACLRAQRRWNDFQRDSKGMTPYLWLYGIAISCLRDQWRREAAHKRDLRREMCWPERSSVQFGLGLVGDATTPSEALARKDLARFMHEMLVMLKEKDREILWMRHFDGLSFREVGKLLEIRENTASVRYVRAVERLRELWKELHPDC